MACDCCDETTIGDGLQGPPGPPGNDGPCVMITTCTALGTEEDPVINITGGATVYTYTVPAEYNNYLFLLNINALITNGDVHDLWGEIKLNGNSTGQLCNQRWWDDAQTRESFMHLGAVLTLPAGTVLTYWMSSNSPTACTASGVTGNLFVIEP